MSRRDGLVGRGTIFRLLRRWRIPRVIRHVAKSLFLYWGLVGPGAWPCVADMGLLLTVTAPLPCARGLRIH
ncbi:hypothetical protein B1987_08820 [Mycobacterium kansasii]|nr:hypothetical protein B1987_08820 [Mycobacterium kansasii]